MNSSCQFLCILKQLSCSVFPLKAVVQRAFAEWRTWLWVVVVTVYSSRCNVLLQWSTTLKQTPCDRYSTFYILIQTYCCCSPYFLPYLGHKPKINLFCNGTYNHGASTFLQHVHKSKCFHILLCLLVQFTVGAFVGAERFTDIVGFAEENHKTCNTLESHC